MGGGGRIFWKAVAGETGGDMCVGGCAYGDAGDACGNTCASERSERWETSEGTEGTEGYACSGGRTGEAEGAQAAEGKGELGKGNVSEMVTGKEPEEAEESKGEHSTGEGRAER